MSKLNQFTQALTLLAKRRIFLGLLIILPIAGWAGVRLVTFVSEQLIASEQRCYNLSQLDLKTGVEEQRQSQVNVNEADCYKFHADDRQALRLSADITVQLITPSRKIITTQGEATYPLTEAGDYLVRVEARGLAQNYTLKIAVLPALQNPSQTLSEQSQVGQSSNKADKPTIVPQPTAVAPATAPSYNVNSEPLFRADGTLQDVVNQAVSLAETKGLPTDRLSISLIDLESSPCCTYAGYADQVPRFPASISKLFLIVALFGYYQANIPLQEPISDAEIHKLIQDSDNNAASHVLDQLTDTRSGQNLSSNEFAIWNQKRQQINQFFERAGYQNINVSQKNFPIPDLNLVDPEGRDLQMRGDRSNPLRNYLTTYATARLLFEISQEQAISKTYSQTIQALLKRDYERESYKQYDSIRGFLGEGLLPEQVQLFSKPGWTKGSRQDAALIYSQDDRIRYVLIVFGDDAKFAEDWQIFPQISRMVYETMQGNR